MNVARLLDDATLRIASALGLEKRTALIEARALGAYAWQVDTAWLIAHDTDTLADPEVTAFASLLARRLAGEPIAYLVGTREFYGRPFQVTPDVLIPRPETELLVDLALARIPPDKVIEVLDLGTGSGCIAITLALERPAARVSAVDSSGAAWRLAQRNAETLNARVEFFISDWFDALEGRRFDLIVSNPPYIAREDPHLAQGDIRFEPLSALQSGKDGLSDLRRLIAEAGSHLHAGGILLLEHGYDQALPVQTMLKLNGFHHTQNWADLAGTPRVSGGILSE